MKGKVIVTFLSLLVFSSCTVQQKVAQEKQITEKYWKLISLEGKKIQVNENRQKEAHFVLKEEEHRVSGNTGCNSMGGSYEIADGNLLKFSKLFSTKMYCEAVPYEKEFLKALENTRSFKIQDDTLFLLDTAKNNLARFEAVYMQ